ncbi:MAG: UvrB/UvrC motif-containing protein [Bacillaceae bacterium]|nr:UvrB/UvrC motif-containing protein [Bacillaceae bacterium]
MRCQECGERPATLHFTKIVNGEKTELNLCEQCAQEKGDLLNQGTDAFSIHHLLSGLMNFDQNIPTAPERSERALRCETCGLTYNQFAKSGRFGCSNCYKSFSPKLDPLFRRIHGNTTHSGKVPTRAGGQIKLKRELQSLKDELKRSIEEEAFERAAEIRDQIRELEKKIASG